MRHTAPPTLIMALIACVVAGCAIGTRSVSGRVTSGSTGAPVAGAIVRVGRLATTTADDGTFHIDGAAATTDARVSVLETGFAEVSVAIPRDSAAVAVTIPDASLRIAVAERATEAKPVTGEVQIALDGKPISVDATVGPLTPGVHHISISGERYLASQQDVTLTAGSNQATLTPSITATETYSRYLYNAQYGRQSRTYQYLLPAERRLLPLKTWIKTNAGTRITSYQLAESRVLPTWKSKLLPTKFANVVEVDRTYKLQVTDSKFSDYGQTYTNSASQHWILEDGIWYMLHPEKFW